jgi:hypothetical protein
MDKTTRAVWLSLLSNPTPPNIKIRTATVRSLRWARVREMQETVKTLQKVGKLICPIFVQFSIDWVNVSSYTVANILSSCCIKPACSIILFIFCTYYMLYCIL